MIVADIRLAFDGASWYHTDVRHILPLVVTIFSAAVAIATAAEPTVTDLLALEGKALFKAADEIGFDAESKFSPAELVKIAEKLGENRKTLTKEDKDNYAFSQFFNAACMKATSNELDRLIDIYVRLEPDSFEKQFSFQPLAGAWILREIASLDSVSIKIAAFEKPPPPELADAPPDLTSAWKAYKSATAGVRSAFGFAPEKKQISFQANENAFFRLLDNVLLKREEKVAERLAEFGWSGWCGTGADLLYNPRSIGIFMSLLRERRMPEALGAAIELQSDALLLAGSDRADVRIAFLEKCGVDWESVFVGAQLDAELENGFPIWGTPHLIELTAYGSNKAAIMVAKMALRAKPEFHESYASALAAFVSERSEEAAGYFSGRDFTRVAKTPISTEAQAEAIRILQLFATPKASPEVASTALKAFDRAKLASTKGTIRALLEHPSPDVSQEAARILRSMGEPVEMAAATTAPVRFQIFVNGVQISGSTLMSWQVESRSKSVSSSEETDETGTINVPREYLLKAQQEKGTLEISSSFLSSPDTPSFFVILPAPKNLDQITRVEVEVWPLELRIERTQSDTSGEPSKAAFRLQRHEEKGELASENHLYFGPMAKKFEAPIDAPVPLAMQRGTYDLELISPGTERFVTTFEAGPKTPTLNAKLKPGGDVHVEIVRPDGERGARSTLFREGKEIEDEYFDYETKTYRGLPVGHYILHISSSGEVASKDGNYPDFAPIKGYAGLDVPFAIVGNVPASVDLGEIRLEAAPD